MANTCPRCGAHMQQVFRIGSFTLGNECPNCSQVDYEGAGKMKDATQTGGMSGSERLEQENQSLRTERQELSSEIERCHALLDRYDPEHEQGTTALTPLDERLQGYLFPAVITDGDVDGED